MHRLSNLSILFLTCCICIRCTKPENGSEIPKIELIGVSKTEMTQGDLNQDSLWLQFRFEDGDGDLGYGSGDSRKDIRVIDGRTGNIQDEYKIPDLIPSDKETQKGVLTILIFTSCCLFKDNIPPCSNPPQYPKDSLDFIINLIDKAGHISNDLHSGKIYLNCK
ncbi:MAG: hypothetical protein IPO86_09525 [Saprospiraceae bacterium]|nr:hypothetical protein [Saprospiraceae bacterium]MBK9221730.1 hypothetical protein [Saprospiraceae bacterium]MBK9728344.1 hypothetical protein [Saprospiraceae bacterium]